MTAPTDDWVGRIGGSGIGKILGLSPFGDAETEMRRMVRKKFGAPQEFTGNIATEWGNKHEHHGITAYERLTGEFVQDSQTLFVHPDLDFLGVRPDGLIDWGDRTVSVLSVKCPYRGRYTHWEQRPDFAAQMHLEMACLAGSGVDVLYADLAVWRTHGDPEDGFIVTSRLDHDPDWLQFNLPTLQAFIDRYNTTIADPELAAPYLEPLVDVRDDQEWSTAAAAYLELWADHKAATEALADATARLKELAGGRTSHGAGARVTVFPRKGVITASKLVADGLVDPEVAEKYRGAPSVVTRVEPEVKG